MPDFEAAMARIHKISGTRTQVELAELLGIRQSSISDAKRRASVPASWLVSLFILRQANPTWITTGQGRPYLTEDEGRELVGAPIAPAPATMAEPATLDDLLAPARAMLGPGREIMIVPAGARVTVDLPRAVYTMDDMDFTQPVPEIQEMRQLPRVQAA